MSSDQPPVSSAADTLSAAAAASTSVSQSSQSSRRAASRLSGESAADAAGGEAGPRELHLSHLSAHPHALERAAALRPVCSTTPAGPSISDRSEPERTIYVSTPVAASASSGRSAGCGPRRRSREARRLHQHDGRPCALLDQRLQRHHPLLVGGRRDDDYRRVPAETPAFFLQQLGQWRFPGRIGQRERLQRAAILLRPRAPGPGSRFPRRRRPAPPSGSSRGSGTPATSRCARRTPRCSRRRPHLHVPMQVEHDPDVARRVHLERLHHQPSQARRRAPVDAVVAVAWVVLANAGGVRRHVVRPAANCPLARQLRDRRPEVRQLLRARTARSTAAAPRSCG